MSDVPLAVGEPLTWVEVSQTAFHHNIHVLRQASRAGGRAPLLCAMVKGNAYGHGLLAAAQALLAAGVDWLGTGDLSEIEFLRASGITAPIYTVCYLPPQHAARAVELDARFVVYDDEVVAAASAAARACGRPARLHVKVETGNNRQGLRHDAAVALAERIAADPHLRLEGLATHFADVEDTTNHAFARSQLQRFEACAAAIRARLGLPPAGHPDDQLLTHVSNSAALLLWPEVCGAMVRFGIAAYGLWPSKETLLSVQMAGKQPVELRPALTWKTRIAQLRDMPAGEYIGYGRTFRTVRPTKVALLPIGYYDGYDRGLSNLAQVLIHGQRAHVIGRVAMNMVTVDATDCPEVAVGDEVVLLGAQGGRDGQPGDEISAEQVANWLGTIHYEVVTRIGEHVQRRVVA
ncbi:MAG: alanine racemase [Deltaproteobacteria bacterium]|nr:alanine racemase [Deltaproteobacteria bacterium]